jgi:hypothetical protein
MQSQKKFKRPKRLTMNAQDFARPFAQNVESYEKAVIRADNFEESCRRQLLRDDITIEDRREYARTAGFWSNVAGILRQYQTKMGEKVTPKRAERKVDVKKDPADRRQAST